MSAHPMDIQKKTSSLPLTTLIVVLCGCIVRTMAALPWERADVINVYSLDNEMQCRRMCWYRSVCSGYSYAATSHTDNCVLHSEHVHSTTFAGWVSRNVTAPVGGNGCASRPCGLQEVCAPMLAQHKCLQLPPDSGHLPPAATTEPETTPPASETTTRATTSGVEQTAETTIGAESATVDVTPSVTAATESVTHATTSSAPSVNTDATLSASTVSTSTTQTTTKVTTEAFACPTPPLPERTFVTRAKVGDVEVANYSCSVKTDIRVKGTTGATCTNGSWSQPTILCAPTTCWYNDSNWGPVYGGTVSTTISGYVCDRWDANVSYYTWPPYDNDDAYTVDGSVSAAQNYCRIFANIDNYYQVWCYSEYAGSNRYDSCGVPQCASVPGQLVG